MGREIESPRGYRVRSSKGKRQNAENSPNMYVALSLIGMKDIKVRNVSHHTLRNLCIYTYICGL
jgi:hypothetical protein